MENKRLNTLLAAGCVAAFFAPLNANAEITIPTGSDYTKDVNTNQTDNFVMNGTSSNTAILNVDASANNVSLSGTTTMNGYSTVNTAGTYNVVFNDIIINNATNNFNIGNTGNFTANSLTLNDAAVANFTNIGATAAITNLNINGNSQLNTPSNVSIGGTTIAADQELNITSDAALGTLNMEAGSVLDLTSGDTNTVTITSLASDGLYDPDLSFDGTGDRVVASGTGNGSLELSFVASNILNVPAKTANATAFINVANENVSIDSIATETNTDTVISGGRTYYISYNDESGNFEKNTVRLTTYNVISDSTLDALLLRGTRGVQIGDTYTPVHWSNQLPNMESSNTLPGKLTISARNAGANMDAESANALLTVDSTDGNSRTLTLEGLSLKNADRNTSNNTNVNGGALYINQGTGIANVEFVENAVGSVSFDSNIAAGLGGAVYNGGGSIISKKSKEEQSGQVYFSSNEAQSGGAIYNKDGIVSFDYGIVADSNKATASGIGSGGAVYNDGGQFALAGTSEFTDNTAVVEGGAIYNTADGNLTLDGTSVFDGNNADKGGAIYNNAALASAAGSSVAFNSNGGVSSSSGGAIFNNNQLDIKGDSFVATKNSASMGGALYNSSSALESEISSSTITFSENSATSDGGAIENVSLNNLSITGGANTFTGNAAGFGGGAIHNDFGAKLTIGTESSTTNFTSNTAGAVGGAIYNGGGNVDLLGSNTFTSNSAGSGGAIYNHAGTLNLGSEGVTTTFSGNTATEYGGAIASSNNALNLYGNQIFDANSAGNGGAIASGSSTVNMIGTQTFTNNTASGRGGAIYMIGADEANRSVINLTSNVEGNDTVFRGNTDSTGANAIYMDGNSTLNLTTQNGANIIFDDPIAGNGNGNVINQIGNVYYNSNNAGYAGDFNLLSGGNAYFVNANSVPFQGGNYSLGKDSTLHLMNGRIETINANSLTLPTDGKANITIDLDLTTARSDRFNLSNSAVGNLLVTNMNITGDTDEDYVFFPIAQGAQVSSSQRQVDTSYYTYDVLGGTTGLTLMKGDISDTGLQAGQVAANAATLNQLALYNQLLFRVDEIAESRYFTSKNKPNLYAATTYEDHPTIDDTYTPYVNQQDGGCVWFKPGTTLERVSPDGFSGYKNKSWNALLGYETPIATLRSGFEIINTVFGGYQGSYQDFDEAYNYQNGGFGGYMANIYKKNFFMGFTALAGGIGVNTTDDGIYDRGQEFGLFNAGAAMRLGYNVGMGKHWLLQPLMTTSYTLISGYNTENDRGEGVAVKPTNTLQLAPGFKIIGNYNGWQPYALFDYTWALGSRTLAHVNDVTMPEMRLKSYVEYGVGLRKNMGERFVGHVEAVMRNGGRTGPSFQGGLVFKF